MKLPLLCCVVAFACSSIWSHAAAVPLFDGKSLSGWEGETSKVWRVDDGAITGGSMAGNPRNEFLATRRSYRNFHLKLEYKLVGTEGFVNGGVQIRSRRITNPAHEMSGYQADIGAGYSGSLYDESRRNKMLAVAPKELITRVEKPGEWNTYEIIASGPQVRLRVNGTETVNFTEADSAIEQDGLIALQIHGDCKAVIAFRNITIEELPPAPLPESTASLQRFGELPSARAAVPAFPDARFTISKDEVVVFAGQTNFVREQRAGDLEARLSSAFARNGPRFRSMAWEGDTVYEQWRDNNFGSWAGQLEAAGATMVVAQFGQIEALDGTSRLPEFNAAYHRLLDQFAPRTTRLVLISPMPFERPLASHAPDLRERNGDVQAYVEAVRAIARQRGAVFVDLFTPLRQRDGTALRLTENGMHLTPTGVRLVGQEIARTLELPVAGIPPSEKLREAIQEKNRLWFDCWRPANWNFVYGDRATQLFATATGDQPSLRETFERHKPLIAEMDRRIHALALGSNAEPVPLSILQLPAEAEQLTPEAELATFTLAPGYQANLFASEKDGVINPIQFAWDERGRLFVACSPTYPHLTPGARPGDFILILEDTDGDGRSDKTTRFAEGLTMVQGVQPGDGGVYVCDSTDIVHLRDTDGDGRSDERRVLLSGFGTGDTHQLVNSITYGPDGSLWFTQGLHIMSRIETPWGLSRLDKAGVWRLRPRTLRLNAFFSGAKAGHNCWGVAFDDFGQVFHKTGDRPDGYYSLPGLIRHPEPAEYHGRGSILQTTAKTTSLDFIGTRALPADVQGCAITGGFMANTLEAHRLLDDGAGFKTEQLPKLLTSTSDAFRPVDVGVGPDGAIYVADWFNRVIGHYQASYRDPLRNRTHGRIWRITHRDHAPVKQPKLAAMAPAELLEQLRSPERWTRSQAKRLLFAAPTQQVTAAANQWLAALDPTTPDYERLLLEVVGIFEAHETAHPALLAKLLAAKDPRVRAYGTRVAGAWSAHLPDTIALLKTSAGDTHPRVRLEAIVASSYVESPQAVEVVAATLAHPQDRFIEYAATLATRSLQPQWQGAFAAGKLALDKSSPGADFLRKIASATPPPPSPGKAVYDALCLNCHQPDGRGLAGIYPPLVGSEWVRGDQAALVKMLLHGLAGPITVAGQEYGRQNAIPMPPSGLEDQQIADVLTYVRSEFGGKAPPVSLVLVAETRKVHSDRATFWTAEELGK